MWTITAPHADFSNKVPDLDSLRWRYRVLLIFAPNENDDRLKKQRGFLKAHVSDLRERDLKIFELYGSAADSDKLRENHHVGQRNFEVILIGKDGSEKLRESGPIKTDMLFRLIDSMPMRRRETQAHQR